MNNFLKKYSNQQEKPQPTKKNYVEACPSCSLSGRLPLVCLRKPAELGAEKVPSHSLARFMILSSNPRRSCDFGVARSTTLASFESEVQVPKAVVES